MKLLNAAIMALGIGLAGLAAAHTDEALDMMKAPNGGQLRMAGMYHYELVIKPTGKGNANEVVVFVTDHGGKEIDTKGATGTATVLSDAKATVPLQADGRNRMKGSGNFGVNPKLKTVVSIVFPGQQAVLVRFTPFAAKPADDGHMH